MQCIYIWEKSLYHPLSAIFPFPRMNSSVKFLLIAAATFFACSSATPVVTVTSESKALLLPDRTNPVIFSYSFERHDSIISDAVNEGIATVQEGTDVVQDGVDAVTEADSAEEETKPRLSTGAIVGIAVGGGVLLIIIIATLIWRCCS